MKGDPVPEEDHTLRYVSGQHVDTANDGSVVVTGGGFIAKPKDDNKPSCNWLECLPGGTLNQQVQEVRDRARLTYGATAKLARLNVGQVCSHVKDNTADGRIVTIIEDPLEAEGDYPEDLSHALMTNIPDENDVEGEVVGDLIRECVIDIFPARTTP